MTDSVQPIAWYMPDAPFSQAIILHSDREKYRNTPYWSKAEMLWPIPLYETDFKPLKELCAEWRKEDPELLEEANNARWACANQLLGMIQEL